MKAGMNPEGSNVSVDSLKTDFINDMCEYWKGAADIPVSADKETNIFEDISGLFGK
jgi:hypothetical protein